MVSLRQVRAGVGALVLLCVAVAAARPVRRSLWDEAVARQEAFEAEASHTRAGFARVLQGFRAVYYADPGDRHAAEAVNEVAALLAKEGRELHDPASSRAAIKQYDFLRKQYPGSPLRAQALLAQARIQHELLDDRAAAQRRPQPMTGQAPRNAGAAAAHAGAAKAATANSQAATETDASAAEGSGRPAPASMRGYGTSAGPFADASARAEEGNSRSTGALVSGIRHWSTSSYTRVAIDLGGEVKFEAARVANPDRLYFDLHGARLAPELVGKSFDVTDNGFLRRIRAAQEPGAITRVVLDVSGVTEYAAFLLPNPERLIIDIHGGSLLPKRGQETATVAPISVQSGSTQPQAQMDTQPDELPAVPVAPSAGRRASAAANRSGLPPMAPTDGGELVRPPAPQGEAAGARASLVPAPRTGITVRPSVAHPVPNATAVRAPETATEVAAVSEQPGRVEATRQPTAKPVVATVHAAAPAKAAANSSAATPVNLGRRARGAPPAAPPDGAAPAKAAERTADGETSLVRALGLRIGRIVIDPGHGGHDSGTLGVDGIEEKDVVLDVALRLGRLLHERLGAEIIYTRSDDTFIPLETRTAIANKAQADLFLSIHANSSPDPAARGVETYYLNFTSDPNALDVAARENAAGGQSVHQLSDLVKKIALKDKIAESREFAADVESSLYAGLEKGNDGLKNRGVKKAPFVVLIGANMPSILAEISFVTNARDASQLREPEYRERVAESLFAGVAKYENGLAGGKLTPGLRASAK